MTDWKALGERAIARFPKVHAFLAADEKEEKTMQPKDPINWNRVIDGDPWEATVELSNPEHPEWASRVVKKFIPPDLENAVDDGTCRCIACGQIDDEPWHEDRYCGQWNPLGLTPFEAPPMPPVITHKHTNIQQPEPIDDTCAASGAGCNLEYVPKFKAWACSYCGRDATDEEEARLIEAAPKPKPVIGSPEWKDMAERCEWAFMRDIIDEAIKDRVGPVPSYWYVVRGIADERSKKGWRES